jgi:hypothetical protein
VGYDALNRPVHQQRTVTQAFFSLGDLRLPFKQLLSLGIAEHYPFQAHTGSMGGLRHPGGLLVENRPKMARPPTPPLPSIAPIMVHNKNKPSIINILYGLPNAHIVNMPSFFSIFRCLFHQKTPPNRPQTLDSLQFWSSFFAEVRPLLAQLQWAA